MLKRSRIQKTRKHMQTDIKPTSKLAYSVKEACFASSLGRTTVYAHIKAERLKAVKIGGRTVIPAESLHALIAGRESESDNQAPLTKSDRTNEPGGSE